MGLLQTGSSVVPKYFTGAKINLDLDTSCVLERQHAHPAESTAISSSTVIFIKKNRFSFIKERQDRSRFNTMGKIHFFFLNFANLMKCNNLLALPKNFAKIVAHLK